IISLAGSLVFIFLFESGGRSDTENTPCSGDCHLSQRVRCVGRPTLLKQGEVFPKCGVKLGSSVTTPLSKYSGSSPDYDDPATPRTASTDAPDISACRQVRCSL